MPGASTPAAPPRTSGLPIRRSISSAAMPPGLSSLTKPPSTLTIVDSSPTAVGPPSTISGMREPRSASTAAAVVALTRPEELALGAASGRPSAAISSAPNPFGILSAIVSRPAVTSGWILAPCFSFSTSVSGPGQNASASSLESGSNSTSLRGHVERRDMGDQRIEARPALHFEDARDRHAVGGVAGKAVDGLGGDGHHLARFDQGKGPRLRILACNDCRHASPAFTILMACL